MIKLRASQYLCSKFADPMVICILLFKRFELFLCVVGYTVFCCCCCIFPLCFSVWLFGLACVFLLTLTCSHDDIIYMLRVQMIASAQGKWWPRDDKTTYKFPYRTFQNTYGFWSLSMNIVSTTMKQGLGSQNGRQCVGGPRKTWQHSHGIPQELEAPQVSPLVVWFLCIQISASLESEI